MMKRVELLAPAGNMESFYGAINAGADAVYLAGKQYGARAYADNFSTEELLSCLRYAHLFHKKIYLTVNTLMKEEELDQLPEFLTPLVDGGLDGVIVQDFGALHRIHKHFPELPLHASTQMNITGSYGAKALKEFHVVRIVPARELSLDEIRDLVRESGMEVECFIHGAMCYCYSGQCLFSSVLGGRSGNRGRCAQPCRLPYQVNLPDMESVQRKKGEIGKDKKALSREYDAELYPLSLKDMCTLEILPELIEAGISSFKIEGRMKKPEYTAGVTAIYRKYIDLYYDGMQEKNEVISSKNDSHGVYPETEDLERLRRLYIRTGIGQGYYHKHNGKDMITIDSPSYSGSDDALLKSIQERYLSGKKKLPVRLRGIFHENEEAMVQIALDVDGKAPKWLTIKGNMVERASQSPITGENVIKQLSKLGDSSFQLTARSGMEPIELIMDENFFYPLKLLNDLRREAVHALEEEIIHEK